MDFKLFLCNDDNKTQLFRLLLDVVKSNDALSKIEKCEKALFVVEGKVFQITVADGQVLSDEITEIQSNQEETDTRIVILYLDTGTGKHRQLINVTEIAKEKGQDY